VFVSYFHFVKSLYDTCFDVCTYIMPYLYNNTTTSHMHTRLVHKLIKSILQLLHTIHRLLHTLIKSILQLLHTIHRLLHTLIKSILQLLHTIHRLIIEHDFGKVKTGLLRGIGHLQTASLKECHLAVDWVTWRRDDAYVQLTFATLVQIHWNDNNNKLVIRGLDNPRQPV